MCFMIFGLPEGNSTCVSLVAFGVSLSQILGYGRY
jgi:hypothetical protein